jgi:formylglycine-generating enzyme required for sulfatase activity
MAILVRCASCGGRFRARDEFLGKQGKCPSCSAPMTIAGERVPNHEIFLSYSNKDKTVADAVCAALEANRIRCWIAPRDIIAGAAWGGSIIEAIEDAQAMVLIYSDNANHSSPVASEVERASAKGRLIMPFRIDDSPMSREMEFFLSRSHWFDAMTGSMEEHLKRFVPMVRSLLVAGAQARQLKRTLIQPYVLVSILAGLLILAGMAAVLLRGCDSGQLNRHPSKLPESVAPGAAPVVSLVEVEVVAIKTQAESAWEQVKGLDRGQGVGAALDEARGLLAQAKELYAKKALPEAKAAYVKLAGRCADLASAEPQRKEQNFQKLLAEAKKTAAGLPAGKNSLTAAQKSDAAVALKAVQAALAYKPMDREALALRDKIESYSSIMALELGKGVMTIDLGSGITMKLVLIPAGKFIMGAYIFKNQPEVAISNPFYMGVTEVTQAQYEAVMGTNPGEFKGPTNPVERVSWQDAYDFCRKLSEKTLQSVRLPTETEWEYACRAGTQTRFSFGDSNSVLGDYAWYGANSGDTTHPVGQKKPNVWGLYDTHGNVAEWCADWFYPKEAVTGSQVAAFGKSRVLRGGSWGSNWVACYAGVQDCGAPGNRINRYGFRVAVSVSQKSEAGVAPNAAKAAPALKTTDNETLAQKSEAGVAPNAAKAAPALKTTDNETLAQRGKIESDAGIITLDLGNGVAMKLVLIYPGQFMMGYEVNQHRVTLSKHFYMGVTEVTQAQYQAIMGTNPSNFKGETNPVEMVSWNDATEFCKKLSEKTRQAVRLPTEAEWEYACRAGTATAFSFGDSESVLGDYAWCKSNSGGKTKPVGQKKPNAWGLYDMHGNVWEWCADVYGDYPKGAVTDPQGAVSGSQRALRSGSWYRNSDFCRAASRGYDTPVSRFNCSGFRVVVSVAGVDLK